jgi:hypothetical protein
VIKIIYRELSSGLHASAETAGGDTIISLLPGLTPEQRRAALRRIRHSGRMGHGPRLPAVELRLALGLDRIKAITCTGAAVVRLHPAGTTVPVVLLSVAAVIFVLMAKVSIHVLPGPKSPEQSRVVGGVTPSPTSSAPQASQRATSPAGVPGQAPQSGAAPSRLVPGQHYPTGGSAASGRRPAVDTSGATPAGTVPSETGTGTGLVAATPQGPGDSGGSGASPPAGTGPVGTGTVIPAATGTGSTGSGSGSSGSSGSAGGACVTLLSLQACVGL